MVTIAKISDNIGEYIGEQAGLQTETKKICYGVECILIMIISLGIILMFGWLLGAFKETILITLAALFMKHIIGGPHLSGFIRCTTFSALILAGAGWALKTFGAPSPWWLFILAMIGCGVVLLYGPLLAEEFHFSEQQIKGRKVLGVFFLIFLSGCDIFFSSVWLTAVNIGFLLTIMLRTPAGVLIVQWVEQLTKGKEAQSE
ncbi:MAG TPA: hypothetical protein DDW50_02560 [Firmicutes bacterium]|jgi:accessory gene regulator B|nr:hypothetical protein [Bacillota bacterium]